MAVVATSAVSAFEQIHNINTRAVFGGSILLLCCLVAASLFAKYSKSSQYIFIVLIGTVALTSGVLFASAVYVTQHPEILLFWNVTL